MVKSVRAAIAWVAAQWLSRLWLDPLLVALIVGIHAVTVRAGWLPSLMHGTERTDRPALYGAAAIVLSLTGTLGSLAAAQYLDAQGDRVRELKRRHPATLGLSWKVIFVSTLVSSILFLAAYRADLGGGRSTAGSAGEWIFEVGVMIALTALARLVALFWNLVDLIVLDETDPLTRDLSLNPVFFKPVETSRR